MKHKVITTSDGSTSLYLPEQDETYHSKHGAIQESRHVFINEGLAVKAKKEKELSVLEIGFGTGCNALLSYYFARRNGLIINYTGIEPFPLSAETINSMNYAVYLKEEDSTAIFNLMHETRWEKPTQISDFFSLLKKEQKIEEQKPLKPFDVVYYDAFGPNTQAKMWEQSHFEYLKKYAKQNAILATYCAQGQFKRNLKAAGWQVEGRPGPPGKRQMTLGFIA